ncbi:hypothetical protein FHR90_000412 [Endobacter medicaginis]|uniref:Uncharacterized protein n=1 Tax=Endobacter medicaginis TaxID=1181271 RepID=A0A839UQZ7_9PROT|nr:hypothetical protein [Endobacter medicaginis]MBB3172598.1 hypothetical protein [Endobacter medicaginis]MCX5476867.1 hypothetical protein [Endobacter medicaginis]NVN29376.1 hypothetical protein [Endobacter medicaginis]
MPFDSQNYLRGLRHISPNVASSAVSVLHTIDLNQNIGRHHLTLAGDISQPLQRAIVVAQAAAPHLAPLAAYMIPHLPGRPRAGAEMSSAQQMYLGDAILQPLFTPNSPEWCNALVIDCDAQAAVEALQQLPPYVRPTLVIDAASGRCSAIVQLETPVRMTENKPGGRKDPRGTLWYAGALMAAALDGVLLPHVALVRSPWALLKNLPGHETAQGFSDPQTEPVALAYRTIPGTPDMLLTEIVHQLHPTYGHLVRRSQQPGKRRPGPQEPAAEGTNRGLFDRLRAWAFERHETDADAIAAQAEAINDAFAWPLSDDEVASVSSNVTIFMQTKFVPGETARNVNRGVMQLAGDTEHTVKEKQAAGADYAAYTKRLRTERKIADIVYDWNPANRITQTALAEAMQMSTKTMKRAWGAPLETLTDEVPDGRPDEPHYFRGRRCSAWSRMASTPLRNVVAAHNAWADEIAACDAMAARCHLVASLAELKAMKASLPKVEYKEKEVQEVLPDAVRKARMAVHSAFLKRRRELVSADPAAREHDRAADAEVEDWEPPSAAQDDEERRLFSHRNSIRMSAMLSSGL